MTGERYDRFDDFVEQSIVSESTARVKLWAKDGTVIYSDDPDGVGEKFPGNESLQTALRGEIAVEVMAQEAPENEHERNLGTQKEVYTTLVFPDMTEPLGVLRRVFGPLRKLGRHRVAGLENYHQTAKAA